MSAMSNGIESMRDPTRMSCFLLNSLWDGVEGSTVKRSGALMEAAAQKLDSSQSAKLFLMRNDIFCVEIIAIVVGWWLTVECYSCWVSVAVSLASLKSSCVRCVKDDFYARRAALMPLADY